MARPGLMAATTLSRIPLMSSFTRKCLRLPGKRCNAADQAVVSKKGSEWIHNHQAKTDLRKSHSNRFNLTRQKTYRRSRRMSISICRVLRPKFVAYPTDVEIDNPSHPGLRIRLNPARNQVLSYPNPTNTIGALSKRVTFRETIPYRFLPRVDLINSVSSPTPS
jgi:hypothetical protein